MFKSTLVLVLALTTVNAYAAKGPKEPTVYEVNGQETTDVVAAVKAAMNGEEVYKITRSKVELSPTTTGLKLAKHKKEK